MERLSRALVTVGIFTLQILLRCRSARRACASLLSLAHESLSRSLVVVLGLVPTYSRWATKNFAMLFLQQFFIYHIGVGHTAHFRPCCITIGRGIHTCMLTRLLTTHWWMSLVCIYSLVTERDCTLIARLLNYIAT